MQNLNTNDELKALLLEKFSTNTGSKNNLNLEKWKLETKHWKLKTQTPGN